MLNIEKSREIAELICAEKKACWRNALLALLSLDFLAGYSYIEGWVFYIVPMNHGWLISEEGEIIDPTLVLNEIQGTIQYFPAIIYSLDQAAALVNVALPAVENDGHGGYSNNAYMAAFQAAMKAASE